MCTTSLYVPWAKLRQFQELVKAHDMRFLGNPLGYEGKTKTAYVTVTSDHLDPGAYNLFWQEWQRLNTPVVEKIRKPSIVCRIRKLLRSLFR